MNDVLMLRLATASLELTVLAVAVWALLALWKPAPRVAALAWTVVLAKPLVSLVLASPVTLVRLPFVQRAPATAAALPSDVGLDLVRTEVSLAPATQAAGASKPRDAARAHGAGAAPAQPAPSRSSARSRIDALRWVSALWLLGAACFALRGLLDAVRVHWLLRAARTPSPEIARRYAHIARALGIARPPRLLVSPGVHAPALATVGGSAATVLLPSWFLDRGCSDAELEWSLRHELAHWRLRDPWARCLRQLVQVPFFFHPVAWWAGRRWEEAAELACDRAAVGRSGESREYATALVGVFERSRAHVAGNACGIACGMSLLHSQLGRRVQAVMALDPRRSSFRSRRSTFALLALSVAAFAFGGDLGAVPRSQIHGVVHSRIVRLQGVVTDPEGSGVGGARVVAAWPHALAPSERKPLAETRTRSDGTFEISFDRVALERGFEISGELRLVVVGASAQGFGPAWVAWDDVSPGERANLRLAVDDVPITGRVLDLEGRPIAGARVRPVHVRAAESETLGGFIEALEASGNLFAALREVRRVLPGFASGIEDAVTDSDGRFRVTGVGRERLVQLSVDAPQIAQTRILVASRTELPDVAIDAGSIAHTPTLHAADAVVAAAPTRPIEGRVLAADTGEPVAGARITTDSFAGSRLSKLRDLETVTDAHGAFRLNGMPRGRGNAILVTPPSGMAYFARVVEVPEPDDSAPARVEVALHPGVFLRGRVTDAATQAGILARVSYFPTIDNPHIKNRPDFDGETYHQVPCWTDPDGSFRLVVLPGRALVAVRCGNARYPIGTGADEITCPLSPFGRGVYEVCSNPLLPCRYMFKALREIDVKDASPAPCDFALAEGLTHRLTVLDPEGRPASGVLVHGVDSDAGVLQSSSSEVEVVGLAPGEVRLLLLHDAVRDFGAVVRVSASPDDARASTVTLQPCATVTGRVVDADGDPVAGALLPTETEPSIPLAAELPATVTGPDGRFRLTLLPGSAYTIRAGTGSGSLDTLAESLEAEPGAAIDLGDVRIGG